MLLPQLHAALGPLFSDAGLPENVLQILNFAEHDVAARMDQLISHQDVAVSSLSAFLTRGYMRYRGTDAR